MLPYDVLERIADFADADARRAMGFAPRKLNPRVLRSTEALVRAKLDREYECNGCISTFRFLKRGTIAYIGYDVPRDTMSVMFMKDYENCSLRENRVLIVGMRYSKYLAANQYVVERAFDAAPCKSKPWPCVSISAVVRPAVARDAITFLR